MRRKGLPLLIGLLLVGAASVAGAQVLPSTPIGPGFVSIDEAAGRMGDLQFTVEVVGTAPTITGGSADHFLTFNQTIDVPGAALEPGTYVFHLVAPSVMQVRSVDRTRSLLFMVHPVARAESGADYRLELQHLPGDTPQLTEFFVPNQRNGFGLVYGAPSSCERILRRLSLPTTGCFG